MFLKGMMITNQLLYQLSYKGMGGYINQKPYFAIQNKIFCSQLLLKLLAYCVGKLLIVTNKSSPNRLQNPIWNSRWLYQNRHNDLVKKLRMKI